MKNCIGKLRKEKHLTRTELSAMSGVSRQYLRDLELGNSVPSIKVAKRIADCLDHSIDDIFFTKNVVHDLQS